MNLYYNGVDICRDVSLNYCVHEMYAEKQADTLVLRFNDPKGIWSRWGPSDGDTIRLTEGAGDTGQMFLHSAKPENGLFTVRAMSMPGSGGVRKSKSWAGVRFLQLGNEIAAAHGLAFQNYGCTDQVYPYLRQENETDFSLFSRLCTLEGCQMLLYDGKLLAYSEQYLEQQDAAGTLEVDENGNFAYQDRRSACFGSCEVSAGACFGSFTAPDAGGNTSVLRAGCICEAQMRVPGLSASGSRTALMCSSSAEAARFARGILRNVNKYGRTGRFSKALVSGYAAGSVLHLKTGKACAWDGPVFLYKVRNDYAGNKSTLYFRNLLEGW